MMKVRNLENNFRAVANQFIIFGEGKVIFQSYNSTIVEIDNNNNTITVYPDYNYSRTTTKYRNIFMNKYGFSDMGDTKGFEKCLKKGNCEGYRVIKNF